ncbi:MAG TPA: nitrous oxide reductase accessory protein NosL [Longimicrobiaceae bacterium]
MLAFLTMGCTGAGAERGPRELALGIDACEYCHMTVDDPLRAAQWIPREGRILTFDEPGCLVAWLQRNPDAEGRAFVADAETGEWLPAHDAVFHVGVTRTGMGFDVVSYADGADPPAGGELLRWDELLTRGVRDAHTH